ncbi:MAG: class I SAM-dependent methyltransferase [Bacteroidales bacterium]|nr:class I SAM-dependent methyltransferase [Bacteroidales bacterium]
MSLFRLLKTALTSGDYYKAMNYALTMLDGDYQMLHYPFKVNENESFSDAQNNLIEYCMSHLPEVSDKKVLDLGCGNGMVSFYLAQNHNVNTVVGVDVNHNNVTIANAEKIKRETPNVYFIIDDAQNLTQIEDDSFDILINIESAFHYPNKDQFMDEVHRVLKPGGQFIIADIVRTKKGNLWLRKWKKRMNFNHWSEDDYITAFSTRHLELESKRDISHNIIKGFKMYREYLNNSKLESYFNGFMVKFFFMVNVKLNIYLLKNRRKYYVFHGQKNNA